MNHTNDDHGLHRSCGRCDKTIRMREDSNNLLCTATLDVVQVNYEDVCEHYCERAQQADIFTYKRF